MSENVSSLKHEQHEALLEAPERLEALPDAAHAEALRTGEADPLQKLQEARETIKHTHEQTNNPLQQLKAAETAQQMPPALPINRELKHITLQRELSQLQRKLPLPQRLLSRTIHQPIVRTVSEAGAKSLTRPSGLLGGGLIAFLGSSSYLYLAKHIGFTYNYVVLWLLFVAGFIFGLVIEMAVWLFAARKHKP